MLMVEDLVRQTIHLSVVVTSMVPPILPYLVERSIRTSMLPVLWEQSITSLVPTSLPLPMPISRVVPVVTSMVADGQALWDTIRVTSALQPQPTFLVRHTSSLATSMALRLPMVFPPLNVMPMVAVRVALYSEQQTSR